MMISRIVLWTKVFPITLTLTTDEDVPLAQIAWLYGWIMPSNLTTIKKRM
jgi:hypothetical protein